MRGRTITFSADNGIGNRIGICLITAIGKTCRPIDLLRCKLSFFGASKFDPRSDRWTRITLYQGAPTAADLDDAAADDWAFWVVKDGDNSPQINA